MYIHNIIGYITENIKQMLRMQAATNVLLQDVKQRIIKIEDLIKNSSTHLPKNNSLIAQFLPFNIIKDVKEFESLLNNTDEAVTQFVSYKFIHYFHPFLPSLCFIKF